MYICLFETFLIFLFHVLFQEMILSTCLIGLIPVPWKHDAWPVFHFGPPFSVLVLCGSHSLFFLFFSSACILDCMLSISAWCYWCLLISSWICRGIWLLEAWRPALPNMHSLVPMFARISPMVITFGKAHEGPLPNHNLKWNITVLWWAGIICKRNWIVHDGTVSGERWFEIRQRNRRST